MEEEVYSTNGSGMGSDRKVNSALVTAWPEPFDIEHDILKEDKATRFQTTLKSALRTRKLYDALQQRPPTMHAVMSANPGIGINDAQEHFDNLLRQDKADMGTICDMLYALVKWDSLLHEDRNLITAWVNEGDARAFYAWLIAATSILEGKAQDKLRVAYAKVTINATDSPQALIRAMQTKWFLFKNNTMYARETQDGLKEGLRDLYTMMLNGPERVASHFATKLSEIETAGPIIGESVLGGRWQELHARYARGAR